MKQLIIMFLVMFMFMLCTTIPVMAQVTIGSDIRANEGALLDLKEYIPDNSRGGATADKGLALPRVKLVADNLNSFGVGTAEELAYTGLIVYNVATEAGFCPGLYVWDGNNWSALSPLTNDKKPDVLRADGTGEIWDHEGKKYSVAKFGDAWWMTTNLASETSVRNCGKALGYIIPGGNKDIALQNNYGFLYSWNTAIDGETNYDATTIIAGTKLSETQGICPEGWVLPSDLDWSLLEKEISAHPGLYSTYTSPINWYGIEYDSYTGWYRPMSPDGVYPWGNCMLSQIAVNGQATQGESLAATSRGLNILLVGTNASSFGTTASMMASTRTGLTAMTRGWSIYKEGYGFYSVYRGSNLTGSMSVRCKKK